MLILTGAPNCSYCSMLENVVKKLGVEYRKVDVTKPENVIYLGKIRHGGFTMPATLIHDEDIYRVSAEQPAKVAQVKAWLEARVL